MIEVKKRCVFLGTIIFLAVLFMVGAMAADTDIRIIANGDYTITSTDTSITIADNLTVTLIGSSSVTYDLPIICGAGVALTLRDVQILQQVDVHSALPARATG